MSDQLDPNQPLPPAYDPESLRVSPQVTTLQADNARLTAENAALKRELDALRALVAKKDEALADVGQYCANYGHTYASVACHRALVLTPADVAGKTLVDAAELAELRKDKDRLEWVVTFLAGSSNSVMATSESEPPGVWEFGTTADYCYEVVGFGVTLRAAIDAAKGTP